ncbi:MAG: site-specific DNA-methyltransferase [Sulfurimonas sp.]|jgi:adenine-specific DNA-methyltransferase
MSSFENYTKEELIKIIQQQEKELESKKYGLVWDKEREPEQVVLACADNLPILKEVSSKHIRTDDSDDNILIEGDSYHALSVLNYTHKNKIDVIYIDPPYNTGENDFKYNDKFVEIEDKYRHSKWLNFMEKRLNLAYELLQEDGILIVHIDEHELSNLQLLLIKIFGDKNSLGSIVWNKKNPKGDSKGISVMHETIVCFAKNKEKFLELGNTLKRPKPHAEMMLKKANQLFRKLGKTIIPDEIKEVIKPFNYPKEVLDDFKITYNLELLNKEFQNWLNRQDFSNGEKAYKFIDENAKVYQSVSMAWPNKKKAPDDYFIPLVHPDSKLLCPVPARGWRNPPVTMQKFLKNDLILFGKDENTQPRRKYILEENMYENITSIYENASSDDEFFKDIQIEFPYPKPVEVAKYLISTMHPNPKLVCDFMAGSGTTGHAILDLNRLNSSNLKFILCTNNENNICEDITLPRLRSVITGYINQHGEEVVGINSNLKYFKTSLLPKCESSSQMKINLTNECSEMLCIKEGIYNLHKQDSDFKIYISNDKTKYLCVYFNTEDNSLKVFLAQLKKIKEKKIVYIFSESEEVDKTIFKGVKNFEVEAIPQKILNIYKQLVKQNISPKTNTIFLDLQKAKDIIFINHDKDIGAQILRNVLQQIIDSIAYLNGMNLNDFDATSRLNDTLKSKEIFSKIIWEENKTYLAIGNSASHSDYNEYEMKQVQNFYVHVQTLIKNFGIGR